MSSSTIPQPHQPESEIESGHQISNPEPGTSIQESSDTPSNLSSAEIEESSAEKAILSESNSEESAKEGDEEEEGEAECGFCLFMKGGGCKDTFVEWEKCVAEGEKNDEDIVEKCFQVTSSLKKCMEAHSDYYAPLLQAEKAAEQEAAKQLEEEKARSTDQEGGGDESKNNEKDESSEQK